MALEEGIDASVILEDGLLSAMSVVGERFKRNEVFVPEVLVAARAMNAGIEILKPKLAAAGSLVKGKVVIVKVRAGEAGRLYGSITTQEIADALKAQHGIELDKRKIDLDEKVTSVGQTSMTLKLSAGVSTKMILNIVAAEK